MQLRFPLFWLIPTPLKSQPKPHLPTKLLWMSLNPHKVRDLSNLETSLVENRSSLGICHMAAQCDTPWYWLPCLLSMTLCTFLGQWLCVVHFCILGPSPEPMRRSQEMSNVWSESGALDCGRALHVTWNSEWEPHLGARDRVRCWKGCRRATVP